MLVKQYSKDLSPLLWNAVHGAWSRVSGWLGNALECCPWGMGQGLWGNPKNQFLRKMTNYGVCYVHHAFVEA